MPEQDQSTTPLARQIVSFQEQGIVADGAGRPRGGPRDRLSSLSNY
jgi:hypothetical protein